MEAQVLGLSVDSEPCLKAWADSLGGITYPLLSDFYPHGRFAQLYGILRSEGYSERAIFVIDKRGVIRYVDIHKIDEQPDNEVLFQVLDELAPGALSSAQSIQSPQIQPQWQEPDADVVLYCTPWCPDCRKARTFFQENHIEYVEVDISRNREAAARVRQWNNGFETTPTFNIRGTILSKYNPETLVELIGK
jgi:glutaredoxin